MTGVLGGLNLDNAETPPDDTEATIAREIRILQSVEVQRANPAIVLGNPIVTAMLLVYDPSLMIASGAIYH